MGKMHYFSREKLYQRSLEPGSIHLTSGKKRSRKYASRILHSSHPIWVEVSPNRGQRMPAPRHLATRLDRYSLNLSTEISGILTPRFHRTSALRFRALLTENGVGRVELARA
jgi:hypothetical protein